MKTAPAKEFLADRIKRSSKALAAWSYEATLPWADRAMTRAIAETEIGLLRELCEDAPAKEKSSMHLLHC